MRSRPLFPLVGVALVACTANESVDPATLAWPDAHALANPIGAEHAALPWPSDQYLVEDATTATGFRVDVGAGVLPDAMPPSWFAGDDGFSRVAPILTWLPGLDPASLPDANDWGATLDVAASPILLLRASDGAAVPVLAEIDRATDDAGHAPVILRPHRTLDPDTRYVVVLRDGLRGTDGAPLPRDPATVRLLASHWDDPFEDPAMAAWATHFETVRATLDLAGIDPDSVLEAWTFSTRSEAQVTGPALATQDAVATRPLGAYTLEAPVDEADRVLVRGSLTVPRFLDDDNRIALGDDGTPVEHGTMQAPFLVTIPKTVTATRPTILFGHGFFSSIEEPTWGNLFDGLARWQMAAVTTEFFGFSEDSLAGAVQILFGDFGRLDTLIDQQLQSHADFTLVQRLIAEVLSQAITVDFGSGPFQPLSGTEIPYLGISNGGTQGLVMLTTSPVLDRGALVVAGGGWSHMLQRAAQWNELGIGLTTRFEDPRDLQIALSLLQQVFDPADSLNYVDHLVDDRLDGRPMAPELLLIQAKEDAQVANLVTAWVAGNAGFALTGPSPVDVWGVEASSPDAGGIVAGRAGYTVYDLGVAPNPEGNVAPVENDVHGNVRTLDAYRQQVGTFLEFGTITHPCDGPCDPE